MAHVRDADSELRGIWDENDVPVVVQDKLVAAKITKVSKFAHLEDDVRAFRVTAKELLGVTNAMPTLEEKGDIAALVDAWQSAVSFVTARKEAEAEARVLKVPVPLVRNDHINMRKDYEEMWHPLEDRHVPGSYYVEKRFEDTTNGDFRAETLAEVHSVLEEDGMLDEGNLVSDKSGNLKLRKGVKDGKMPKDSEQMRDKMVLITNCTLYTKKRFPSRRYLSDFTHGTYDRHVAYVLGEDVAQFTVKDDHNNDLPTPRWEIVLSYEYQLRKKAYQDVCLGRQPTLDIALEAARKDTTLKEKHFLTPYTVATKFKSSYGGYTVSKGSDRKRDRSRTPKKAKGNQNKKGKQNKRGGTGREGRGPSKRDKPQNGLPDSLPTLRRNSNAKDGKPICYSFNLKGESCHSDSCRRVHVCWWCLEKHPGHACPKYDAAK
jgi:hypothetical protein